MPWPGPRAAHPPKAPPHTPPTPTRNTHPLLLPPPAPPIEQVPFRHRSNPTFDETLELVLDGATAGQPDLEINVEAR